MRILVFTADAPDGQINQPTKIYPLMAGTWSSSRGGPYLLVFFRSNTIFNPTRGMKFYSSQSALFSSLAPLLFDHSLLIPFSDFQYLCRRNPRRFRFAANFCSLDSTPPRMSFPDNSKTRLNPKVFQRLSQLVFEADSEINQKKARYDVILLDQFGVLHDGVNPYPAAIDCVRQIAETTDIKIVILSNSSRRSDHCLHGLEPKGFKRSWFHGAVTSGEITYEQLRDMRGGDVDGTTAAPGNEDDIYFDIDADSCPKPIFHAQISNRLSSLKGCDHILHVNWSKESRGSIDIIRENQLKPCGVDLDKPQFIVAHGTEGITESDGRVTNYSIDQIKTILEDAYKSKNLQLICANPDFVAPAAGSFRVMPGALAETYENLGGAVHRFGKPDPIAYEYSCALFPHELVKSRVLAIGDSLTHDIQGALNFEIDSVYIAGGIDAAIFGLEQVPVDKTGNFDWYMTETKPLNDLCTEKLDGHCPTYVLPFLRW